MKRSRPVVVKLIWVVHTCNLWDMIFSSWRVVKEVCWGTSGWLGWGKGWWSFRSCIPCHVEESERVGEPLLELAWAMSGKAWAWAWPHHIGKNLLNLGSRYKTSLLVFRWCQLVMFLLGLAQILRLRLGFYGLGIVKFKAWAFLMGLGQPRLSFSLSHSFAP